MHKPKSKPSPKTPPPSEELPRLYQPPRNPEAGGGPYRTVPSYCRLALGSLLPLPVFNDVFSHVFGPCQPLAPIALRIKAPGALSSESRASYRSSTAGSRLFPCYFQRMKGMDDREPRVGILHSGGSPSQLVKRGRGLVILAFSSGFRSGITWLQGFAQGVWTMAHMPSTGAIRR